MKTEPRISVIIPVWNAADRISATLDALRDQTASADSFEVLVVDNGSTDRTGEIARSYPFVTVLEEPAPGSYRARNRALQVARGQHVLFTDGDCIPAADWIERAIANAELHPEAGVIGGHIELFRETEGSEIAHQYEQFMAFNQAKNIAEGRCVTANWLSPRALMEELNGFDASLLSGGDVECSQRIAALGKPMVYDPGMIVGHPSRPSLIELIRKRRRTMGGRWKLQSMTPRQLPYWMKTLARETGANISRVRASDMPSGTKVGLYGCFLLLLAVAELEMLALALGKSPYRS